MKNKIQILIYVDFYHSIDFQNIIFSEKFSTVTTFFILILNFVGQVPLHLLHHHRHHLVLHSHVSASVVDTIMLLVLGHHIQLNSMQFLESRTNQAL